MTTIIRQGNMIYSDSCYGTPIGTERTRVFGEPKFFINRNKTIIAAICGNIPGTETADFITTQFIDAVERYLSNWKTHSTHQLSAMLENYYTQILEIRPKLNEFYSFAFFIKDFTLQIAVKINKHTSRIRCITYGTETDLTFGSGAAWWTAQKGNPELTLEDRFKYIYRLDPNSGGTVNIFDLNNLKEITV